MKLKSFLKAGLVATLLLAFSLIAINAQELSIINSYIERNLTRDVVRNYLKNRPTPLSGKSNIDLSLNFEDKTETNPDFSTSGSLILNANATTNLKTEGNEQMQARYTGTFDFSGESGRFDVEGRFVQDTAYGVLHDYPAYLDEIQQQNREFMAELKAQCEADNAEFGTDYDCSIYEEEDEGETLADLKGVWHSYTFKDMDKVRKLVRLVYRESNRVEVTNNELDKFIEFVNSSQFRKNLETSTFTGTDGVNGTCVNLSWNGNDLIALTEEANRIYSDIDYTLSETEKESIRNVETLTLNLCFDQSFDLLQKMDSTFIYDDAEYRFESVMNYTVSDLDSDVSVDRPGNAVRIEDKYPEEIAELDAEVNEYLNEAIAELEGRTLNDIEGHTFEGNILNLYYDEDVKGYGNGMYGPDDAITRGQMFAIVFRAFDIQENRSCENFSDNLDGTFWVETLSLKCHGIISGEGNLANRDLPITRGQASKVIMNAMQHSGMVFTQEVLDPSFDDIGLETTFNQEIARLALLEILNGYDDNSFRPDEILTRGQMAAVIDRAKGKM